MRMSYVIPGIPQAVRLLAFAVFAAVGAMIQILGGGIGVIAGTLAMVPGLAFVWAKNFRNKPVDLGSEDWQPAALSEFQRIKTNLSLTRRNRFPVFYHSGFGASVFTILLALSFMLFFSGAGLAALVFLDAAVLLVPFLFSGNVRLWTPQELAFKMRGFDAIVNSEPTEGGDLIITPYLRLDKDKEGRQIPEDIRLMVEPRRKPSDFLGVQFQTAVNNGPNGAVPYMYAVFLCRGKGETYRRLQSVSFPGMVTEPGGDKEYGFIVVRQQTSRGGYHTTEEDVRRLYTLIKKELLLMK